VLPVRSSISEKKGTFIIVHQQGDDSFGRDPVNLPACRTITVLPVQGSGEERHLTTVHQFSDRVGILHFGVKPDQRIVTVDVLLV
jgi:hypothetical protein